jgi:YtkA-like
MLKLATILIAIVVASAAAGCERASNSPKLNELQKARSGNLEVVLLSSNDALRQGKDEFTLEFRSPDGTLVDAGTVRATATMPMPGSPMFGSIDVRSTETKGRYAAAGDFSMAGTWRLSVEWDGPAGQGSVTFPGTVR